MRNRNDQILIVYPITAHPASAGWTVSQRGHVYGLFEISSNCLDITQSPLGENNAVKKIIFVIQTLSFGGAERSLINLLHELPQEKYEVDLLLFKKKGPFLQQVPQWVNVLEIPRGLKELYSPLRQSGKYCLTKLAGTVSAKLLWRTRKKRAAFRWKYFYKDKIPVIPGQYDVAVAYSGSEVHYLVRDCISAERKMVWVHNDYRTAEYSCKDDLPYFADMDAIVSVSEECVSTLRETFPEYAEKVSCIENITSSVLVRNQAEAFTPEEFEAGYPALLSIGRMGPQKGFDMAISAAAILKRNQVRFRWYIIGEGKLKEKLEKQIQDEQVEDCVILLGTRNNPYPYIKNCTLLVQPSRFEGKSVVLDEAKILGTPIAATCYPTVRDQILEDREGVIMPMNPEGIAKGIAEVLEDQKKLASIRDYLLGHEYGNQKEISKYIELFG